MIGTSRAGCLVGTWGRASTQMRENVISAQSFHSLGESFSNKHLLLGAALSKATGDTSGFVSKIVKTTAET